MTLNPTNTNLATVGAGTLLAAALIGGFITRSGPTGGANDTLDSTANIIAALGGASVTPWVCEYYNTTAYTLVLVAGDSKTTFTGQSTSIATHTIATLIFTPSASGAIVCQVFSRSAAV